jgi:hypothetical protein
MNSLNCQMTCLPDMAQPSGLIDKLMYVYRRLKRFTRRRMNYLKNKLSSPSKIAKPFSMRKVEPEIPIMPGDWVKVRSREEIQLTLNEWNTLKGCTFLEEMGDYCGITCKVYKRVEHFLDERDYRMKRCRGIVFLEGVICEGTIDFGKCDRSCFFFWREEWLEKLDSI